MSKNNLSPLEQIDALSTRYVDVLVGAQGRISPSQAAELEQLAIQLAGLYSQEAAEYHKRAVLWRNVGAAASSAPGD